MTERLRLLPLLAAAALLLLLALGTAIATDGATAAKCKPVCMPPPEEEQPEDEQPEEPPKPNPTPPPKTMLVISVGWDHPRFPSPIRPGVNREYVTYLSGHVNEWLTQSAAPRTLEPWRVASGGTYTIDPLVVPDAQAPDPLGTGARELCPPSQRNDFFDEIADLAEAKARQNGYNPDAYTTVVIQWDRQVCFNGIALGRRIGLNKPDVAMHELGHYYGLANHADSLACVDAGGRRVPLSGNCTSEEYGDVYDAMGNAAWTSFGAVYANQLGWLNGQFFDVTAGDFTRTWTLRPFSDPAHTERALRLRDGNTTLWLQYRTETGVDSRDFGVLPLLGDPGLTIHRETIKDGKPQSQLLDMTPGSRPFGPGPHDFEDAPLPVGQTWVNPLGQMRITLNSLTTSGATVTISSGRVTVPDVRGLDAAQAEARLAGVGLTATGWGSVIDPTCAYIGTIASQNPLPGTRVMGGTAVNVSLGERDSTRECR